MQELLIRFEPPDLFGVPPLLEEKPVTAQPQQQLQGQDLPEGVCVCVCVCVLYSQVYDISH